jgi:hypothetical protein
VTPPKRTKIKKTKKKNISPLFLINFVVIPVLLIAVLSLVVAVFKIAKKTNSVETLLIERNKESSERLDIITQSLTLMAGDTNILRGSMGMPERVYPIHKLVFQEEENEEEGVMPLLRAVDIILGRYKEENGLIAFAALNDDEEIQKIFSEYSLSIEGENNIDLDITHGYNIYFKVKYQPEEQTLIISSPLGQKTLSIDQPYEITSYVKSNIEKIDIHYRRLREKAEALSRIGNNKTIQDIVAEKELTLSSMQEDTEEYRIQVSAGKRLLLNFILNKQDGIFMVKDRSSQTMDIFLFLAIDVLRELDTRSEREKMLVEQQKFITQVFEDPGIRKIIGDKGLEVVTLPRENDDFFYFDINNEEERIGSLALDKYSLEIYLIDKDEVQICSLRRLDDIGLNEKKNSSSRTISQQ